MFSFMIVFRFKTFPKAKWKFSFYKYLRTQMEIDCFANVADCKAPLSPNVCKNRVMTQL